MATPFDWFRKYSKAIFVVMCLVMGSFILSAGVGGTGLDFFDQVNNAFRGGGTNSALAEIYGDKVTAKDLHELRLQRQLANEFMFAAVSVANARQAEGYLKEMANPDKKSSFGPQMQQMVKPLLEGRVKSGKGGQDGFFYNQYLSIYAQQRQFGMAPPWDRALQEAEFNKQTDAIRVIRGLERIMNTDIMALSGGRSSRMYFPSGLGTDNDRDLLTFTMLLKKAGKMKIGYSHEAVERLIEADTNDAFNIKKDWNAIESRLRESNKELTTGWLKSAIANEYAVRAVITTMLGGMPGGAPFPGQAATLGSPVGGVTPFEMFEYYKDKCSDSNFTLLEINADSLVGDVKENPTPKELEELFNKHITDEPDPSRERPGFKDPKKVKLEYVTLDAKDKRLTEVQPRLQAAETIINAFGSIGGNHVTALSGVICPAQLPEKQFAERVEFRRDIRNMPYNRDAYWGFDPRDHSIYQPVPIISTMAALGAWPLEGAVAMTSAYGLMMRQVEIAEHKAMIPPALQQALLATNPSFGTWVGSSSLVLAHLPKPAPEALYTREMRDEFRKKKTRDLFDWDIKTLQEKLKEINTKAGKDLTKTEKEREKDKEAAKVECRKIVDEWVKARGLTIATNKEARDKFLLGTDPDLKVLNDLATSDPEGTNSLSKKFFEFGATAFEPDWFPAAPSGDGLEKPNHLVWLASEVAPETYNNLKNADARTAGAMSKRVEAAWRMAKARELAKAKADELSKKMADITKAMSTNPTGVDKQLRDFAAETKTKKFDVENIALLKHSHGSGLDPRSMGSSYVPGSIPKTSVTYPTEDFVDVLMDLRKKTLGDVVVLHDAPRNKYYVACMTSRREKTVEQFRDDVFFKTSSSFAGSARNSLFAQRALPTAHRMAIIDTLERLKLESGYKETDEFKKTDKNAQ